MKGAALEHDRVVRQQKTYPVRPQIECLAGGSRPRFPLFAALR